MTTYTVSYSFPVGERAYQKGSTFTRDEAACWFPGDPEAVDQKIAALIDEGRLVLPAEAPVDPVPDAPAAAPVGAKLAKGTKAGQALDAPAGDAPAASEASV